MSALAAAARRVRGLWRLGGVLGWLLWGLWVVHTRFGRFSAARREAEIQRWARRVLRALGVEVRVHGAPAASGPLLLVANHISWLDILVLDAVRPVRFVSKADVRHWPLLGRLVAGAGTLFIARDSRRDALRVVHHMAQALQAGDVLAIFPEGTTGEGHGVLPFHANLLQAALASGAPVQPLALAYRRRDGAGASEAPVYVGQTSLLQSLWRTVTAPGGVCAVLVCGAAQPAAALANERRALAQSLHAQVSVLLAQAQDPAARLPAHLQGAEDPPASKP